MHKLTEDLISKWKYNTQLVY